MGGDAGGGWGWGGSRISTPHSSVIESIRHCKRCMTTFSLLGCSTSLRSSRCRRFEWPAVETRYLGVLACHRTSETSLVQSGQGFLNVLNDLRHTKVRTSVGRTETRHFGLSCLAGVDTGHCIYSPAGVDTGHFIGVGLGQWMYSPAGVGLKQRIYSPAGVDPGHWIYSPTGVEPRHMIYSPTRVHRAHWIYSPTGVESGHWIYSPQH